MSVKELPIGVGICGLGRSGYGIHRHAPDLVPGGYEIKGVYDPLPERRTDTAAELNAADHESFESLLADPEVELVVVASPNRQHAGQTIQALQEGKHVLCEKPFGLTTADVDAMITAAERAGTVLQPFQQRRYEPDFQKVQEVCESGLLGQIQFVRICWHNFKRRWDWQTLRSCGGGALNNNGPHPIDHAMALFGGSDPTVWAEAASCLCSGDAEDHLKIILSGEGCPTIDIELSDVFAYGQNRWTVSGTAGGLCGNASGLEWKWVDWSGMPERPADSAPTQDRGYNKEELQWHTDAWQPQTKADGGAGAAPAMAPTRILYETLWRAIREGKPQDITPREVRRRVEVMEKARSASGIPAYS